MMTATMPTASPCIDNSDLDSSRAGVYSPAHSIHSQYSTYSREVKYIFNPLQERDEDEFADYSHIVPKESSSSNTGHYLSHTPHSATHTPLGSCGGNGPNTPLGGPLSLTPCNMSVASHNSAASSRRESALISPGDEVISQSNRSRTNSVISNQSRDRGPISPCVSEVIYSSTNHHRSQQQQQQQRLSAQLEHVSPRDIIANKSLSNPNDVSLNSYSNAFKQGFPSPRNSSRGSGHSGSGITPYSGPPSYSQLNFPGPPPYSLLGSNPPPPPAQVHPPYPPPPNYSKRKTWSPPVIRLTTQAASSRVCHSNDSLIEHLGIGVGDTAKPAPQRSRSNDLDSTPPRLAPISGVLGWKPGSNVIRPIAFKPISANAGPHSPRHPSGEDHGTSHDLARPQAVKLGTGMLGHRSSPEKAVGRRPQPQPMAKSTHHSVQEQNPAQVVPLGGFRHININLQQPTTPANPHHMSTNPHHNNSTHSHHSFNHNSSLNSHNASAASSNSHHNSSATSSRLSCAEDSFMTEFPRPSDRADSVPSAVRGWHQAGEGILQTPSPSDSGVGELEAILREKDAEINTLREVMDRNERAILQVYEERKNAWALDTQDLKEEYERKLKIQSRKSYKTEQVLSLQVYKLQQDQKALLEEKETLVGERDNLKTQLEGTNTEISSLKCKLGVTSGADGSDSPNSNEELALKNKEVINLHTQIHTFQVDMEKKNKELGEKAKELIGCKEEVEKVKKELERLKNPPVLCEQSSQTHAHCEVSSLENVKPSMMGERERTIQTLQVELDELRSQVLEMDDRHEKEKDQWLEEKNKVIRYQKQLQLNYVQMQRKNSTLETEVQQLTLELENRDMKLIALSGEESVC